MADPQTRFTLSTWLPFAAERLGGLITGAGKALVGPTAVAPFVGMVLIGLGVVGARALWRDPDRRPVLGGLGIALGLQILFVLTYNIADIADYHLAIHVLALPFVVHGALIVLRRIVPDAGTWPAWTPALPALLLLGAVVANSATARPSSLGLAERWQERLLEQLPEGAAILTAESGDLFLLWYTQFAEGERDDLLVLPANLHDREWIRRSLPPDDVRHDAIGFSRRGMERLDTYVEDLRTHFVDPLLAHGRVFTTIRNVQVLEALARHYQFRQAAELLRRDEVQLLDAEQQPRAPSVLWELRAPPRHPNPAG